MRFVTTAIAGATAVVAAAAGAQAPKPAQSPEMKAAISCRAETDERARLKCYDSAVAALAQAAEQGQLLVVTREEVRKARRSLFGFSLPKLPFFEQDGAQDEPQQEIEASVRNARSLGYGKWVVELDGGAVWQTTEARPTDPVPRPGQKVRIKKAALGSYMLSVNGGRGIRAMRVR